LLENILNILLALRSRVGEVDEKALQADYIELINAPASTLFKILFHLLIN
jgi:hypothetical protein